MAKPIIPSRPGERFNFTTSIIQMFMNVLDDIPGWTAEFESGWMTDYRSTGKPNWSLYKAPRNQSLISSPGIDLKKSNLLFISSAGGFDASTQSRFDAENNLGDYTIREIAVTTPLRSISFAHTHYDHAAVNQDPQVLVPLNHLDTLIAGGMIGGLADNFISFMGFQPDVGRCLAETIPAIISSAKRLHAECAFLVPS